MAAKFGKRVERERRALGLSQEQLAHEAGVHRTYIGSVERGEKVITLFNAVRIAHALKVDAGDLMRGL